MCLLTLLWGLGGVSATATIAEFLEPFYGLYWCMPREKEGGFWGEAGATYQSRGSNEMKVWWWWSGFLFVDWCGWVVFLVSACVESVGDRLNGEVESGVWVAKPGTWWPGSPYGSRMGYLPWLISYRLLQLNPRARGEHLTHQLSWIAAWLLVTRVCPVYLVDQLALISPVSPYNWANGSSVDVFLCLVIMALVLRGVGAILGNGYGIQGQNYVTVLLGSEMSAEFQCRNLILGI